MAENEFWNNLDNFVEQKKSVENVGNWLNTIPDITKTDASDSKNSQDFGENESIARSGITKAFKGKKRKPVNKDIRKLKIMKEKQSITKKIFETKKVYVRRSKLRRKRRTNRNREPKYFGPQVECKYVEYYKDNSYHKYLCGIPIYPNVRIFVKPQTSFNTNKFPNHHTILRFCNQLFDKRNRSKDIKNAIPRQFYKANKVSCLTRNRN